MPKRTLAQLQNTHSTRNKVAREIAWSQCFMHIALFGYSERQMITLQGVNRMLYKRVAQWVKIVKVVAIRLSEVACLNPQSTRILFFPTAAEIREWRGVFHYLAGFENNYLNGTGSFFNFILCNGARSKQRDEYYPNDFTHMLPAGSHNEIRSVTIYFFKTIAGFKFYDKEGEHCWKIGVTTHPWLKTVTVLIADNEVIVGVVAKLHAGYQSIYTDFQFQIASKPDFN